MNIYTRENKRKRLGDSSFNWGGQSVAIRDGVYQQGGLTNNPDVNGDADAYLVDFYGNIFYNEKAGMPIKIVSDEQFLQAQKEGYHCVRNLSDNEILAMYLYIK